MLRRVLRNPVAQNALALYAVQGASFVLPLLALPYLARVLRPEGWGLVVFSQAFGTWMGLILSYGFAFSGTRDVAQNRGDPARIAAIVAGVQSAKLALLAPLTLAAVAAAVLVPAFRAHPGYIALAWLLAVGQGMAPVWYWQGMERLRGPAALDVCARLAATAGIFALVRGPGQGWMALALQAGFGLASAAAATAWMYRETAFARASLAGALGTLRLGWPLFVFSGAASVYTTANSFVLGLLAPPAAVSFYGAGDKVVRAALCLIYPLSQAMFPRINHLVSRDPAQAGHIVRRSLLPIGGFGVALGATIFVAAPLLTRVGLGHGYAPVVSVLRILAFLPPLIAVGTVIGIHWAIPLGMDRQYNRFVLAAGAANLVLAALLVPRYGAAGMALSAVLAESLVEAGLVWLLASHAWRTRARGEGPAGALPVPLKNAMEPR